MRINCQIADNEDANGERDFNLENIQFDDNI